MAYTGAAVHEIIDKFVRVSALHSASFLIIQLYYTISVCLISVLCYNELIY